MMKSARNGTWFGIIITTLLVHYPSLAQKTYGIWDLGYFPGVADFGDIIMDFDEACNSPDLPVNYRDHLNMTLAKAREINQAIESRESPREILKKFDFPFDPSADVTRIDKYFFIPKYKKIEIRRRIKFLSTRGHLTKFKN